MTAPSNGATARATAPQANAWSPALREPEARVHGPSSTAPQGLAGSCCLTSPEALAGSPLPAPEVAIEVQESFTSQGIVVDTRRGLLDRPKWLSSLYFYDRHGSELFERITRTPEYYPTRTEEAILAAHADEILGVVGGPVLLAELGSGSSRKTRVVLEALLARQDSVAYMPVDVSAAFLQDVARSLEGDYADLEVRPEAAEYKEGLRRIGRQPAHRRLVLFLGSSIGNFEPAEQVGLLRAAHDALMPGDALLLGTDLVKDPAVLHAAYNDADGVTAQFNRNILAHLNRELDGDADVEAFAHRAFYDPEHQRIEMHLVSLRDQTLRFPRAGLVVQVAKGEAIHTENSYKFTPADARQTAQAAGFKLERTWTDEKQWFGLHLLRRP